MSIRFKSLVIAGILGLFALTAIADQPKSYRISITTASKLAGEDVEPGEYRLVVDSHEPKVQFKHLDSGKTIAIDAKVESADRKFEHTGIVSNTSDGTTRITAIQIGGTKTRVLFN